jgi:FKBP-type peptidyl-prolyl cis-trans isomerase
MATFTKEVIKEGSGPGITVGAQVTVEANLYLAADKTAIWSTHKDSGFLFPSKPAPQPFSYSSGTGGVIKGWDDGVGTMKVLNPWF